MALADQGDKAVGHRPAKADPAEERRRARMRRRVIDEWRGLHTPRDTSSYLRTSAELVPALLKSLGVDGRMAEERIAGAWASIVGGFISQFSHPVRLDRRTLVVAVSQPVILHTLDRDLKRDLVAKLKQTFGEKTVSSVRFVAG